MKPHKVLLYGIIQDYELFSVRSKKMHNIYQVATVYQNETRFIYIN